MAQQEGYSASLPYTVYEDVNGARLSSLDVVAISSHDPIAAQDMAFAGVTAAPAKFYAQGERFFHVLSADLADVRGVGEMAFQYQSIAARRFRVSGTAGKKAFYGCNFRKVYEGDAAVNKYQTQCVSYLYDEEGAAESLFREAAAEIGATSAIADVKSIVDEYLPYSPILPERDCAQDVKDELEKYHPETGESPDLAYYLAQCVYFALLKRVVDSGVAIEPAVDLDGVEASPDLLAGSMFAGEYSYPRIRLLRFKPDTQNGDYYFHLGIYSAWYAEIDVSGFKDRLNVIGSIAGVANVLLICAPEQVQEIQSMLDNYDISVQAWHYKIVTPAEYAEMKALRKQ